MTGRAIFCHFYPYTCVICDIGLVSPHSTHTRNLCKIKKFSRRKFINQNER